MRVSVTHLGGHTESISLMLNKNRHASQFESRGTQGLRHRVRNNSLDHYDAYIKTEGRVSLNYVKTEYPTQTRQTEGTMQITKIHSTHL